MIDRGTRRPPFGERIAALVALVALVAAIVLVVYAR